MYVQVDLCAQRPKENIEYPPSLSAYFFEARSLLNPGAPVFSPKLEVNKSPWSCNYMPWSWHFV